MTQPTNDKRTGAGKNILRFLFPLPSSLFFFFSVFFFPVTETYLGNAADFSVPFPTLAAGLLPFVLGAAFIVALFAAFLPRRGRIAVSAGLFCIGFAAWVQSVFLNGKMISLTGERERYSTGLIVGNITVLFVILAAGAVAALFFFRLKKERIIATATVFISSLLLFMQATGTVSGALSGKNGNEGSGSANEETASQFLSAKGETTLSRDHNVVVFILDYTTGPYVLRARRDYPDLFDGLDGFVFYPDALPVFTRTYPSITYLTTGVPCRFDLPYNEYVKEAGATSAFLSGIHDAGIRIGLYTDDYLVGEPLFDLIENAGEERVYSAARLMRYSLPLALKRVAPYLLKSSVHCSISDVNVRALKESGSAPSDEETFYNRIRNEGLSLNDAAGTFRFFHFFGPHPGTRLRADGTYSNGPTDEADALKGDFTIIAAYLSELKRLGIYDKTTVIITTDHADSALSAASEKLDIIRPSDILMMVKPAASVTGYSESDAEISHDDLFATVYDGLGLDPSRFGTPIYRIPSGERTRKLFYTGLFSDQDGEIARLEYEVTGDARDLSNYRWTGRFLDVFYSYCKVSETVFNPSMMEDDGE